MLYYLSKINSVLLNSPPQQMPACVLHWMLILGIRPGILHTFKMSQPVKYKHPETLGEPPIRKSVEEGL